MLTHTQESATPKHHMSVSELLHKAHIGNEVNNTLDHTAAPLERRLEQIEHRLVLLESLLQTHPTSINSHPESHPKPDSQKDSHPKPDAQKDSHPKPDVNPIQTPVKPKK